MNNDTLSSASSNDSDKSDPNQAKAVDPKDRIFRDVFSSKWPGNVQRPLKPYSSSNTADLAELLNIDGLDESNESQYEHEDKISELTKIEFEELKWAHKALCDDGMIPTSARIKWRRAIFRFEDNSMNSVRKEHAIVFNVWRGKEELVAFANAVTILQKLKEVGFTPLVRKLLTTEKQHILIIPQKCCFNESEVRNDQIIDAAFDFEDFLIDCRASLLLAHESGVAGFDLSSASWMINSQKSCLQIFNWFNLVLKENIKDERAWQEIQRQDEDRLVKCLLSLAQQPSASLCFSSFDETPTALLRRVFKAGKTISLKRL